MGIYVHHNYNSLNSPKPDPKIPNMTQETHHSLFKRASRTWLSLDATYPTAGSDSHTQLQSSPPCLFPISLLPFLSPRPNYIFISTLLIHTIKIPNLISYSSPAFLSLHPSRFVFPFPIVLHDFQLNFIQQGFTTRRSHCGSPPVGCCKEAASSPQWVSKYICRSIHTVEAHRWQNDSPPL